MIRSRTAGNWGALTRLAMLVAVALCALVALVPALAAPAGAGTKAAAGWTGTQLPVPPGGDTHNYEPLAISCSGTHCAAGASFAPATGPTDFQGALLSWSGKKWSAIVAPRPAGASTASPDSTVSSVSCPAGTASCFAGGDYSDNVGNPGMLLTWSGRRWSAVKAPLPPDANPNPDAQIEGMACRSATWCTAAGYYAGSAGTHGVLLRRSGKKWKAIQAPVPADYRQYAMLFAVSCPSTTRCVAGGSYDNPSWAAEPYLVTWSGSAWTDVTVPLPADAAANPQATIYGVSCPSVTRCIAVGTYQDTGGSGHGLLLTWSGTKWTAAAAPLPAGGAGPSLRAVSCPATTRCTAVGTYVNAASQAAGLILTLSGTTWTATTAPPSTDGLYGVSCPAITRCLAVGWGVGHAEVLTGP